MVFVLQRVVDDVAALAYQGDDHGHGVNVDDGLQVGYHGYGVVVLDGDHFDEADDEKGDALDSVHLVGVGDNYYFGYYLFQADHSMDSVIVDGDAVRGDLLLVEAFPTRSLQTFY